MPVTEVIEIDGNLFEVVSMDEEKDTSILKMTMPPLGPNYLHRLHRHPSDEPVMVISGQAEVTHGFEQLTTVVLHAGDELYLKPNEWHGIKNLSEQEVLIAHIGHTPMGRLWAQFVREGAALQLSGQLPPRFVKDWFDRLEAQFQ